MILNLLIPHYLLDFELVGMMLTCLKQLFHEEYLNYETHDLIYSSIFLISHSYILIYMSTLTNFTNLSV